MISCPCYQTSRIRQLKVPVVMSQPDSVVLCISEEKKLVGGSREVTVYAGKK